MSNVQVSKLSVQELTQLACTYAALILHDDGQDITGDRIGKLVSAAGVKIEAYWPKLFAKALQGKDINSFFNFGGAPVAGSGPATTQAPKADEKAAGKGKQEQKKKQAPPPPPKEQEQDVDMGDLFG